MAKTVNLTAVEKLSTYNEHTNLIVEQEGELNRVAIADLKISSYEIYKQDEEPIDAPEGALWIDTDEKSSSGGGGVSSWNDLSDKPFIPTKVSDLEQDVDMIPEVTSEDNGKFLRVVDGAWAAVSVPNAEGVGF